MKKSILLFLPLILLFGCEKAESNKKLKDAEPIPLKAGMQKRIQQDNAFAFDLFNQVITDNSKQKNIFIAPLSVSIALGMTWNGANNDTKAEMANTLKMSGMTPEEINEYYRILLSNLPKIDPSTKLNIANSIWYKNGFPVKPDFLKNNRDYFNAEVSELDFLSPKALETINNWCAEKTNNLIKNPLDEIPADAIMYLINAIYFKGIWDKKFDAKNTREADFYTEDGNSSKVDMMHQEENFGYWQDESAQYLDMVYGNKAFSMTVILPAEGKTTGQVMENLDAEQWNRVISNLSPVKVRVSLPKFKIKGKYELKKTLMNMGMVKAFTSEADFSGITDYSDLLISRVIHSTYCDVNEKGTEAAAVTIVEIIKTAAMLPLEFNANRPFIFVIREKSTGVILFMGKIGEVEKYK